MAELQFYADLAARRGAARARRPTRVVRGARCARALHLCSPVAAAPRGGAREKSRGGMDRNKWRAVIGFPPTSPRARIPPPPTASNDSEKWTGETRRVKTRDASRRRILGSPPECASARARRPFKGVARGPDARARRSKEVHYNREKRRRHVHPPSRESRLTLAYALAYAHRVHTYARDEFERPQARSISPRFIKRA